MAITSDYDDLFDKVRGNLGEHFSNYMFIVMDDSGDMYYDYTNPRVGRMLIRETAMDMNSKPLELCWEELDDIAEDEGELLDGD
mgnify:CR=1 FL=1|jgi:hypothetical protein|tara:strand:+ start:316 stop:567 length:252 start_codon:yes stop_codon:yes gene_type:complete